MNSAARYLLGGLVLILSSQAANATEPNVLSLLSRSSESSILLSLSSSQRLFLEQKIVLRVAVYLPDRPPFDMTANQKDYEGLSADYLDVIRRSLGLLLQITRYDNQEEALSALQRGDVDLVPGVNHLEPNHTGLLLSAPYAYDQAVLVSKTDRDSLGNQLPAGTVVLFDPGWIKKEKVSGLFPNLPAEPVSSTELGMGLVAYGKNQVMLSDAISARYLIEQRYQQNLRQTVLRDSEGLGFSFAIQRQNTQLLTLINRAMSKISPQERIVIDRHWGVGTNPGISRRRLQLSTAEQQWISEHPEVTVLANDQYLPFSFFSTENQLRGIAADLLKTISNRTGLVFRPSKITSVEAMISRVQRDPATIIGALTYSADREPRLGFPRPYLVNPFVLVTRTQVEHPGLVGLKGKRVAIIVGSSVSDWLEREWPEIQRVEVEAPIETYELLAEGQVDGVLQPQLGASYLIDRYFPGRLQIDSVIGAQPALVGFATGQHNTELMSILNKALLDIRPDEFNDLIKRWQNNQTDQRNKDFYQSWVYKASLGLLLILLAIIVWNLGLRRQIAERLKAQKALSDQLEFMKVLVDGTPHPIYVRDRKGLLLTCNRAYLGVMEVDLDQVLNKGLIEADILPLEGAHSYKRIHRATLASGEPSFDYFDVTVNGRPYHIYHWALPYRDSEGNMTGVIGGWIDLTEQQNLQHALHQAKDLAEAANRGKSHFLAVMSHEIRTPMSALIGVLELMRDIHSDSELIEIAQKSASGMMELIGEILDLSKIESGKLELHACSCHPQNLALTVIQGFASLAKQKNVELRLSCIGPNLAVHMDSLRFRQIVSNLISNAIKFTREGAVTVELTLESNESNANLRLEVQDTGIGMNEQQRKRLFQPYTQFATGDLTEQMGTGLGLAICQQLTALMKGRLSCISILGQGTCFTLELVVAVSAQIETAAARPTESNPPLPSLNILIVEDHEFNRVVLQRQLESLGMRVTSADNGEEGLHLWNQDDFDYIMTDCNMPQMSGGEMTRRIRAEEAIEGRPPTHVVGMTANAQPQEIQTCLDAGMNNCLFKPVTRSVLERYLRTAEAGRFARLPSFDLTKVTDITNGNDVMTHQLLSTVLRTNQEDFEAVLALFEAEDYAAVGRRCHKILGSARIIQASSLIYACEQLEQGCHTRMPRDEISILVQNFVTQMNQLQSSIKASINI